jgi:hypothetical protein
MTRAMQARVAFALIGIAIWGYAFATDNPDLRLVGIALLALSLVLRFFPGGSQGRRSKNDPAP